jgi:hypothetical protein
MELLKKLSNLMRGIGKDEKPQMPEWFGSYLDEDGIVADVIKRVSADSVALERWLDPWSWKFPYLGRPMPFVQREQEPEHTGCLMFADRGIRNFYGLWHANNPHTGGDEFEITDGVVTDPRHPDNFSGRVIERVRDELAKRYPQKAAA